MPAITAAPLDSLAPCLGRLLALQREAHAVTDFTSPYLAGGWWADGRRVFAWVGAFPVGR